MRKHVYEFRDLLPALIPLVADLVITFPGFDKTVVPRPALDPS